MPYSRLFYHIIWSTKDRLPLLTPENEIVVYQTIRHKVNESDGIVHAANGMPDHVHLVVTLPPKLALATVIGQLKGASAYLVNKANQAEPLVWQPEYAVLTISESHVNTVVAYVERQKQHHADHTLDPRLEITHPTV